MKVAIVCNGDEPRNLFPTPIFESAAAAAGDDVILFFTPSGAPALRTGELKNLQGKGLPDMNDLVHSFQELNGRMLVCDLCLEVHDLKEEDLREGTEIVEVTSFLVETRDAARTFCF